MIAPIMPVRFACVMLLAACASAPPPLHPLEPKILALQESRCHASGDCVAAARAHADGVGGIEASRARAVALLEVGCEKANRLACLKLYQVTCEKSAMERACADERPDIPQCVQLGKRVRTSVTTSVCGTTGIEGLSDADVAAAETRSEPRLEVYYTSRLIDILAARCSASGDKAACRRREWWGTCQWNDEPLPCGSATWPPKKVK